MIDLGYDLQHACAIGVQPDGRQPPAAPRAGIDIDRAILDLGFGGDDMAMRDPQPIAARRGFVMPPKQSGFGLGGHWQIRRGAGVYNRQPFALREQR